jgi:hypothetical protein
LRYCARLKYINTCPQKQDGEPSSCGRKRTQTLAGLRNDRVQLIWPLQSLSTADLSCVAAHSFEPLPPSLIYLDVFSQPEFPFLTHSDLRGEVTSGTEGLPKKTEENKREY